ncbi:MAG: DivIVA domain-containing protein [Acidimicrobiales bacterium]
MDSTDNATSALDTIDTVAFKVGLKGYNVDEVDNFLERLSVEVRQLKDLAQQQRQQLRQAAERINQLDARGATDPVPVTSSPTPVAPTLAPVAQAIRTGGAAGAEQVTSMIAMAQKFIEEAQSEAEERAREFTAGAQERAREIVNEARSRAEDEVNRLNGLKQRLSEDVETLSHQLRAERARIAQVLAEFTHWVETSLQGDSKATPATARSDPPTPTPPAPAAVASRSRPSNVPPPAPAPASSAGQATVSQPTIGQVLKFDQSPRDDR